MRTSFRRRGRLGSLLVGAVSALAIATPSASAIAPSEVPSIGADTGRFTLPITCDISIPALANIKVLNLAGTVDIQGIAPVQAADWLGHSALMHLRTYAHVMPVEEVPAQTLASFLIQS